MIPSDLEPNGIYRSDSKRPCSLCPLFHRRGYRVMVWDATCSDTLALTYAPFTMRGCGSCKERG